VTNDDIDSEPSISDTEIAGPALFSPVVSTQWLADHLGSEKLVVVDATVLPFAVDGKPGYLSGLDEYLIRGHVQNAVFADIIDEFSNPDGAYPFTRPDAARFEAAAGSLGIDNSTTVIVYDSQVGQWASRLWWLFRSFGYDSVAVLDGGLKKWIAENRPIDAGHHVNHAQVFVAQERPELWADKEFVAGIVNGTNDGSLVCGTPPKEFSGETVSRTRGGHIPGSLSVPAGFLVDRETNAILSSSSLKEKFGPVLGGSRIVTYCGGGIAAAADALALTLLGERNVAVYDGSLNEWAADESLPLELSAI